MKDKIDQHQEDSHLQMLVNQSKQYCLLQIIKISNIFQQVCIKVFFDFFSNRDLFLQQLMRNYNSNQYKSIKIKIQSFDQSDTLFIRITYLIFQMGNHSGPSKDSDKYKNNSQTKLAAKAEFELNIKKFNKINVVGKGGFGKVWVIQTKKQKKFYALKQMSKAKVLSKKSVQSVMNELQILKCLHNDFIINAQFAFQDRQNMYLVMDLVPGGDLRFHLIKNCQFSQKQTKFFAACIVQSLSFLHNNGIIHRDVKPENIVFDKKGYLRLTDLGVARIWKPQNSYDTSGTPGYMAPEVLCRCNHGVAADYYALGIIVYQCIFGFRPYSGQTRQQIRDKVLARQAQIKKKEKPSDWSNEAIDFVNQLIQRKPFNRLGNNGPEEVMNHPWFEDIDWNRLKRKQIEPPFTPVYNVEEYQDQLNAIVEEPISPEILVLLRKQAIQNLFSEYYYDGQKVDNPLLPPLPPST